MGNTYVVIAWDQGPKWGQWNERESVGSGEDYEASPPSPSPVHHSARFAHRFSPFFLLFPPITEPGPRLLLWWFYNKDQFKYKQKLVRGWNV